MKRLRWYLLAVMVAVLLTGCTIQAGPVPPTPTPVPQPKEPDKPVFKVKRGTVIDSTEVLGRVVSTRREKLFFQKSGQAVAVNVSFGDMVKEGDVLAEIETGSMGDQLVKARNNLEVVKLNLSKAEATASRAREEREMALQKAQMNLEIAQLRLKEGESKVSSTRAREEREMAVQKAQMNLEIARLRLKEAESKASSSLPASAAQISRAELNLETARSKVAQAQEAAKAAAARYEQDLLTAKTNLDKAQVDLEIAQAAYDRVSWRPDVGRLSQARTLQMATLNYELVLANYERLRRAPPTDNSVELAANAVKLAELELEQAKSGSETSEYQLEILGKSVELSQLEVKRAVAALEGEESYELELLRKSVELSQLEVKRAVAALEGEKDYELELLELDLAKAQAEVESLETGIEAAQIMAPFDGEVQEVRVSIGKQVRAYDSLITLAELGDIEVAAEVSRLDLSFVSVGVPVTITKSAVLGQTYLGHLTRLPGTTLVQGIERMDPYTHFSIDDPEADLQVGDALLVAMELRRRDDVLIVPGEAVRSIRGKFYVELWQEGRAKLVEIEQGLFTPLAVEVKSGLEEGQEVLGR